MTAHTGPAEERAVEDWKAEARRNTRAELAEAGDRDFADRQRMRKAEREQMGSRPYADAEAREHDREMNVTPSMVEAFLRVVSVNVPLRNAEKVAREVVFTGLTVALFARLLERKKTVELHPINLDPYPGTVEELADELVRTVVDLEESGAVRGLVEQVWNRLADYRSRQDDGRAEQASNAYPEEAF